jgi:hypothetical protein
MADDFFGGVPGDALSAGVPSNDAAERVQEENRVVLDRFEEQTVLVSQRSDSAKCRLVVDFELAVPNMRRSHSSECSPLPIVA